MDAWVAILIGAVGTWIIAIVAVGDRLRTFFLKPKLRIQPNGFGDLADHGDGKKARYYFVRVENQRKPVPAHEVQATLTRIEKSGTARPEIIFDEIMPLPWQRQELQPLLTRTLGTSTLAGVFFVQNDGTLVITPALTPSGMWPRHFPREHKGRCTLWVTLRAVSNEDDSPWVRLRIEWSGQWHDGKAEIENQCTVQIDPEPSPPIIRTGWRSRLWGGRSH